MSKQGNRIFEEDGIQEDFGQRDKKTTQKKRPEFSRKNTRVNNGFNGMHRRRKKRNLW